MAEEAVPLQQRQPPQELGYRGVAGNSDDGDNVCARLIVMLSYVLVAITFPFSVIFCIKVVQEYERAVS